jgi:hypothetical protein
MDGSKKGDQRVLSMSWSMIGVVVLSLNVELLERRLRWW